MPHTPSSLRLRGVYTALVTPFTADGSCVDKASLERLVAHQLDAKVAGVVVCGSTGEAATLSDAEYMDVVSFVRSLTRGKCPCVAGVSVSATARAVEMARAVEELGCDGVLVAAPPYNKPTQAGLIAHYKAIHAAVKSPIIGYNIPGRSGVSISPATLGALSKEGIIVGIKESSGSIDAVADTMVAISPTCEVVSGDDSLTLAVLAYGGVGTISASANAIPGECVALVESYLQGNASAARDIQLSILPRIRALFVESNPVPVKTVLALKGIIAHPTVRLPLVPLAPRSVEVVREAFAL